MTGKQANQAAEAARRVPVARPIDLAAIRREAQAALRALRKAER